MFGSNALEITIGVVFAFLSVSLVCTIVTELIAGRQRWRARNLERAIRNLLDGSSALPGEKAAKAAPAPPQAGGPAAPAAPAVPTQSTATNWADRFFRHQLINALSEDEIKPSYVPSGTFALALMHLVAESAGVGQDLVGGTPATAPALSGSASFDQIRDAICKIDNPRVREALLPLVEDARGDQAQTLSPMRKFTSRVELWFEHTMERVSGWYRRKLQQSLLLVALATAVLANIDTVAIIGSLSKDAALRQSLVAAATDYVKTSAQTRQGDPGAASGRPPETQPAAPDFSRNLADVQQSVSRLNGMGIPVGWLSWNAAHPAPASKELDALERDVVTLRQDVDQATGARQKALAGQLEYLGKRRDVLARKLQPPYAPNPDNLYDLFWVMPHYPSYWAQNFGKAVGLLLTALAASLGAPFWFDVLNRFISVRAAGKAPEEKPKDPKKVLKPQPPQST